MSEQKYGFTTTILHNDRRKSIEQGSLHKPVHTSVAFGYADARQLASVFQGKEPDSSSLANTVPAKSGALS